MGIDLFKHVKFLLFNENGRLVYQLDPIPESSKTTTMSNNTTNTTIAQVNNQKQAPSSSNTPQISSSLSEYVFGSVSIQSPANVCISRIHALDDEMLLTSSVFDIKTLVTASTTSASKNSPNNKLAINSNSNDMLSSSSKKQPPNKMLTYKETISLTVKKKLGMALIWHSNSTSTRTSLTITNNDLSSFVYNNIEVIDLYLNELKNNIINLSPNLKTKLIHEHISSCLSSINLYANSLVVSNMSEFDYNDFIDEFMSIIEELDNKELQATLVGILTTILLDTDLDRTQIVFVTTIPAKKSLILRMLFLVYCFYCDPNLKFLFCHNETHSPSLNKATNSLAKPRARLKPHQQHLDLTIKGFMSVQLDQRSNERPNSHQSSPNNIFESDEHQSSRSTSSSRQSLDPLNLITNNTDDLNTNSKCSSSTTDSSYVEIHHPRLFSVIPLFEMQTKANGSRILFEPTISSTYLPLCGLQCIITNQLELVQHQTYCGSERFTILYINCDNWFLNLYVNKTQIPVIPSCDLTELVNTLKKLRKLRADPYLIRELHRNSSTSSNLSLNRMTKF